MSYVAPELLHAYREAIGPAAKILARIANEHRVTVSDIKGPSRTVRIVLARQQAAYEINKLGKSLSEIGRILGGRDHTTALHAIRAWPKKAAALGRPVDLKDEAA